MKRLAPSLLHRAFGWPLGHVPDAWYGGDCEVGGVFDWVGAVLFALALAPGISVVTERPEWPRELAVSVAIALLAGGIGWFRWVQMPFSNRERFARARLRRHECVTCGVKLETAADDQCPACGTARAPDSAEMQP